LILREDESSVKRQMPARSPETQWDPPSGRDQREVETAKQEETQLHRRRLCVAASEGTQVAFRCQVPILTRSTSSNEAQALGRSYFYWSAVA